MNFGNLYSLADRKTGAKRTSRHSKRSGQTYCRHSREGRRPRYRYNRHSRRSRQIHSGYIREGRRPRHRHKPGTDTEDAAKETDKPTADIAEKVEDPNTGKADKPQAQDRYSKYSREDKKPRYR